MATAKRFEDLWVWKQSRLLVKEVYIDFNPGTQGGGDFGFRDQVRRAGVSVMNNIAEGFERTTDRDFARFLDVAKGSRGEVRSMYYLAEDLYYVDAETASQRRQRAKTISAGIAAMAAHLRITLDLPTLRL